MGKLYPVMFAGTGSDVGGGVLAAAFCRIFRPAAHVRAHTDVEKPYGISTSNE